MKTEMMKHDGISSYCADLAARAARHIDGRGNGVHPTAIAQLKFVRDDASTTICSVYEPTLAIIVQGKKKILLGEETYHYGVAQYLVVSVELPVRGFVVAATPAKPQALEKVCMTTKFGKRSNQVV